MKKKIVDNPILKLICDDAKRDVIRQYPEAKKYFKVLTKKERAKLRSEFGE